MFGGDGNDELTGSFDGGDETMRTRGFNVGGALIPIVPGAIMFDMLNGGDKNWEKFSPYRELGHAAVSPRLSGKDHRARQWARNRAVRANSLLPPFDLTPPKRRANAEWALVQEMERLVERFEEIDDPYLRERKADVQQAVESGRKEIHLLGQIVNHYQDPADAARYASVMVAGSSYSVPDSPTSAGSAATASSEPVRATALLIPLARPA